MWPDTFIHEVAERRVVFFIGAGISKSALAALPNWAGLLQRLSGRLPTAKDKKLIRTLCAQGRLLDAAQIVSDGTNRPDLLLDLRAIFQVRPPPQVEIYQNILQIDPKTIVTTNYDEFIEKNFELYSGHSNTHSISKPSASHLMNDLRSPTRSIVKMHGCITETNDLVLDRSSYFRARQKCQAMYQAIEALMTVNTVLFLGYSISDPDIQLVLENINIRAMSDHPHYALVEKFEHAAIKKAMQQNYNINFLKYNRGEHGAVPIKVAELNNAVQLFRSSRKIV